MRQINLLGTISIMENDQPRRIVNSAKGCALITYLIVTGEQQQREHLASLLWSGASTSRALQNLRELLVRVRRDVPEVQTTRQTASFVPTPETMVDLRLLRDGLSSDDPLSKASALNFYKGELLSGFHIAGSRAFSEWLLIEREHIHRRVLLAHQQLCDHYQAAAMWGRGQAIARRWLQLDEWSDEACRHFMRFSAELGQFSAARQMYETFRQRLDDDLGIAPDRETTRLLSQLERKRNAQLWHGLADSPLAPPANLPPSSIMPFQHNRDFVGRAETLREIVRLFARPEQQTVALSGISGIGKTQTAVEFAYRYGQQFHGVYWLHFSDAAGIPNEVATIGGERGMRLYREADGLSTAEQVRRVQRAWQESTPRLLIFDNCDDEQLLDEWLPVTGGCRVLLTSRRGNWSRGVAVVSLDVLARTESVRLLRQLAPSLNVAEADGIATKLADLPLALHLAGSFLGRYSTVAPAVYLRQLHQRNLIDHPSLGGRGAERSPTDHDLSVARTFMLSYEQLLPQTPPHDLLLAIACCAAGEAVPQEIAMRFVGGDFADLTTIDALTELQTLGLLSVHAGRTTMHRLVAQFVRSRSSMHDAGRRVATVLTDLLHEQYVAQGSLHPLPFAAAHMQAVLLLELPDGAPHLPLLRWWAHYLADIEQPQRFAPFVETVKVMLEDWDSSADSPQIEQADCFKSFGNILLRLEGVTAARPFYERALTIYSALDEPLKTAQLINNLGAIALMSDDLDEARARFQQAITLYEQLPADDFTRTRIVTALNNLTVSHTRLREFGSAEPYIKQAAAIVNTHLTDDKATQGWTIYNFGMVAYGLCDFAQARASFQQAYELQGAVYGMEGVTTARAMVSIGTVEYVFGNLDVAHKWLSDGLAIFEQHHIHDATTASGYWMLGKVLIAQGKLADAVHVLERAAALYEQAGLMLPSREETHWLLEQIEA